MGNLCALHYAEMCENAEELAKKIISYEIDDIRLSQNDSPFFIHNAKNNIRMCINTIISGKE